MKSFSVPSEEQLQKMYQEINPGTGMRAVDVIARFTVSKLPRPIRFRYPEEDTVVNVDLIVSQSEDRRAGNRMIVYHCQSSLRGTVRLYELKYEVATCKWFLCNV